MGNLNMDISEQILQLSLEDIYDKVFCFDEYNYMDISILLSTRHRLDNFKKCVNSIVTTCSHIDKVELLIKIDSDDDVDQKRKYLETVNIRNKIVVFPRYYGWFNNHVSYNQLAKLSNGKFLWIFTDGISMIDGFDWYTAIMQTRDNYFKDNIYTVHIHSINSRLGGWNSNAFPIITREWYNIENYISPMSPPDMWINSIVYHLKVLHNDDRRVHLEKPFISHPHGDGLWSDEIVQEVANLYQTKVWKVLKRNKRNRNKMNDMVNLFIKKMI